LFVHIPKCAGTSIELALEIADQYPEIGLKPISTTPNISSLFGGGLQHLTIREVLRNFPEVKARSGLFSFSVVRDPVDRFVSHFLWKHYRFSNVQLDDKNVIPMLLQEIDELIAQSGSLDLFQAPFEGHEYCEGDTQTIGVDDIRRHLLPQCSFLFYRGGIPLDAIYPISAMKALEKDLQQRGAIAGQIPQRMAGTARQALRQMIPVGAARAIQDIYSHDARMHALVCETSKRLSGGACPGTNIDLKQITNASSSLASRQTRSTELKPPFPKKLWMYWHQGWEHAPAIVQKCTQSWLMRNASWQTHFLTAKNLHEVVEIPDCYKGDFALPLPALSDVIRVHVLDKHGGVWVDATTWCVRPLDEWLAKVLANTGFFAYVRPAPSRPLSTWFLAASPQHPILERLKVAIDKLWEQVAGGLITLEVTDDPTSKDYFWLHKILAELMQTDPIIAKLRDAGPSISADAPHYLQKVGLLAPVTVDVEFHIRNKLTNVYKLNRRVELPKATDDTVLGVLFKTL
jgi:hypothetical protein